ncbi:hypothetical protein ABBQ32_008419 [Trebouxia sp. C0010 RCD-2024]
MAQDTPVAGAWMQACSRSWPTYSATVGFSAPPRLCGRPSQPHRPAFRCDRRQVTVRAQPNRKADPEPDNQPDFETTQANYQWSSGRLKASYESLAEEEPICLREIAESKQFFDEATGVQKGIAWLLYQAARAAWRTLTAQKKFVYKADLKLKQLGVVETAEEVNNAASDAGRVPSGQDFSQQDPIDVQWLLAAGAAKAEEDLGRPANRRARRLVVSALVQSALFAALIRPLFGVDVLQQWNGPQKWSTWAAFTALYLVSLFSIDSSAGEDNRAQSMQQLTWFPPGRAQPGWTPARDTQQTYMRELAALDLKQASQFAAFQAFSTSLIWRGIVLVLVYTALHGKGDGAGMDSHMAGIQRSFQVGLVALPSWAQSQSILEVVAITAGIEAVVHELLFITEAWRQPSQDFDEEFLKVAGVAFKQKVESTEESAKAQVSLDTLKAWVPLSGERISQHALVSALLALEVLVTGSLPAAMLTQALGYMLGWQNVRSQQSLGND